VFDMSELFDIPYLISIFPELLLGLWKTVLVSAAGIALALLVGLAGGMLRYARTPLVDNLLSLYTEIVRNTPNLILVFFLYFGLPDLGVNLSAFATGTIALAVVGGAYCIESFRAGFLAVPVNFARAGRALAMNNLQVFIYLILPNGLRIAFPSIVNNCISLIKTSTLLLVVGYGELMGTVLSEVSLTFKVLELFTVLGLFYLALIWSFSGLMRLVEHRLAIPGR